MSGFIISGDPRVVGEVVKQQQYPTKTFKSGKQTIKVHLVTQEPTKVVNKFTGQSVILPPEQVDLYDVLIGTEKMLNGEVPYPLGLSVEAIERFKSFQVKQFRAIREWFRNHNIEAFYTLID